MQLSEGSLTFTFNDTDWRVERYDEWSFYRNQFQKSCGGNKAVDFLAYHLQEQTLWLIEVKDYRHSRRTKEISLWEETALKVRDTLAGICAVRSESSGAQYDERDYATQALTGSVRFRVVLHLEQPRTNSKLFPRAYNPANVQQKLKQMLKPVDAHPKVMERATMRAGLWSVAERGTKRVFGIISHISHFFTVIWVSRQAEARKPLVFGNSFGLIEKFITAGNWHFGTYVIAQKKYF